MNLLCPVTKDGRHKKKPWGSRMTADGAPARSGMTCAACHKTWTYRPETGLLLPTYECDWDTSESLVAHALDTYND